MDAEKEIDVDIKERSIINNTDFKNSMKNFIQANTAGVNNKKAISGDHFYIGDGIMRWSNFFVALDHVELVAKYQQQKESAAAAVALICIGALVMLLSLLSVIARAPGFFIFFLLVGGGMLTGGVFLANYYAKIKPPFLVQIRLGSGHQITLTSISEEFIDEIIRVIEQCINDQNGVYQILLNEGVIQHSDTGSIYNIGQEGTPWENVYTAQKEPTPEQEPQGTQVSVDVSREPGEDEWMRLGKFLIRRITDFTPEQEEYAVIEELMAGVGKHDQDKTKRNFQHMGKEMLLTIFGKTSSKEEREEMLRIIRKILQ